jgi:hypothetical protein
VLQILLNVFINQKQMSINDFKIYALNSIAMVVSFSNVEAILKIFLLLVSIVYTIMKTIELINNKKNDNKADNS